MQKVEVSVKGEKANMNLYGMENKNPIVKVPKTPPPNFQPKTPPMNLRVKFDFYHLKILFSHIRRRRNLMSKIIKLPNVRRKKYWKIE